MKQQYQAYATATQTVPGTRQVVMLYDGVVRYLQQAREAMQGGRIEERYNLLIKASEIIFGLQSCLDFDNGGDIAKILHNFYSSADARIFALHRAGNPEEYDRIITDIRQMRDAWSAIDGGGSAAVPAMSASAGQSMEAMTFSA